MNPPLAFQARQWHHINKQGRFNNCTADSLYRIMVTATSVMAEMKTGNIGPRMGIEPTSLAFWASVIPSHHVGSLMSLITIPTPTCLCSSLPQRSVRTTTIWIKVSNVPSISSRSLRLSQYQVQWLNWQSAGFPCRKSGDRIPVQSNY